MSSDGWVGDIGHLVLADSALGVLIVEILGIVRYGEYPTVPTAAASDQGLTTKNAATKLATRLADDPGLAPEGIERWLDEVVTATRRRDQIVHAVAVNRCATCGSARQFRHPRSGGRVEIDRSQGTVVELTESLLELYRRGGGFGEEIAEKVNNPTRANARDAAEQTGEIQNPPMMSMSAPTATCATCDPEGRGHVTISLGRAETFWPRELWKQEFGQPSSQGDSGEE